MTRRMSTIRVLSSIVCVCSLGPFFACSETVAPAPPSSISIDSGNFQYSRRGTPLPEPLVVRVTTDAGDVPQEAYVVFEVIRGGEIPAPVVQVDNRGQASTTYTLGPATGTDSIRASIQGDPAKSVVFEATSAEFYCPEQEDVLSVHYRTPHNLFLATHNSSLYPAETSAGVVDVGAALPPYSTSNFAEIPGGAGGLFDTNIFDAAFSARGDFYVARRSLTSEILKIDAVGSVSFFAHLSEDLPDTELYAEITTNPSGLLVGCDAKGPFVVGCRDRLLRFEEATYEGGINNDAVAVDPRRQTDDPLGEDIYFIDKTESALMRLAVYSVSAESLTVEERGLEAVATLSEDEAANARGMVCEKREGHVYILVDSEVTKELLEVTPAGVVSVLYNFFNRGQGSAAGVQRDLAYDEGYRFLYTLDTLNDNMLLFDVNQRYLLPMFDDPVVQGTLSNRGSNEALIGGERVGLAVLR